MIWPDIFIIEDAEGQSFEGFQDGSRWNGWACPMFEKEEAIRVLDSREDFHWRYDVRADAFYIWLNEEDIDYPDEYIGFDRGDRHLYAIGAWAWPWQALSLDQLKEKQDREEALIELHEIERSLQVLVHLYPGVPYIKELRSLMQRLAIAHNKLTHEGENRYGNES